MKARISNIITESVIKSWKPGDNVLVSAPMGSGKSYFCKNTLYNVAKNNNDKILMLIHRSNCVDQFSYEITESKKDDGMNSIHSCDIDFVHQLQHAIRLCGIDKEIEL